jgi:hypothetical protein
VTGENPTLGALIGSWHTTGEVLGDDGVTVVATIDGSDEYEWLGPIVVHRVDVVMGDRRVRALEIFEPYDPALRAFPTRAYDDQGGVETSTASVDEAGVWTFHAGESTATLRVSDDGAVMSVRWVTPGDDGTERPWLNLRLERRA